VSTPTGGRSNAVTYTYAAAAPTVSSISPAVGPNTGGTAVTVSGTNLHSVAGSAYSLTVGGRAATSVVAAVDGTSLTAVVPAGSIGAAEVRVTNAGGTSAAATYTYQWPVTPVLTIAGPRVTTMKSGRVALTGALKLPSGTAVGKTTVRLESRAKGSTGPFQTLATATTASSGKIAFTTYPGSSVEYRFATVGDVTSSSTVVITIQPAPVIRSISSTTGTRTGGETVTIVGENLFGARVTVGGTPASSVSVSDDGTSLTFVAPAKNPGKVTVQVITVTGKATAGSYSVAR
jgi:IPT/TIG domain